MAPAALLLLVLTAPQPTDLQLTGEPDAAPVAVAGPRELDVLCAALEPGERLRPRGDAVARAEAEDAHEDRRELVTVARYQVVTSAAKLRFAPYDRGEGRLLLSDTLVPLDGGGRLFLAMEAGLPVEVPVETARKILAAQRAGQLALEVSFDLADDTTCSRGRPHTLPVEPVSWSWVAGGVPLARGGAAAERPLPLAGAQPRVSVGEPLQGPAGSREDVQKHAPALQACYGEALRRAPGLDGVLVVELAPGRPVPFLSADSVGDAGLAECVRQALAGVVSAQGLAAVPIRFELEAPASASR